MFNDKYNTAYPSTIKKGASTLSLIGHWNDMCGYYQLLTTGEVVSMDRLNGRTVFIGDSEKSLARRRGWTLDGKAFKEEYA